MPGLEALARDVRRAWRRLWIQPLLTSVVVVTLAVGIGLDVGAFTIIDGLLFRPRVANDPDRFVQIDARDAGRAAPGGLPTVSRRDYVAYRDGTKLLHSLAAWSPVHATLRDRTAAPPQDSVPLLVTCNFFGVYPVRPLLGRLFTEADCSAPGAAPIVLIGESLWRRRFDSNPGIVGQAIRLDARLYTVVGVLPADYDGQLRGPLWIPYTMNAGFFGGHDLFEGGGSWLIMVGRLRPGALRDAAAAELSVIARQQDQLVPGRQTVVRLTNGSTIDTLPVSQPLPLAALVMGALSLVLLIACANVSTLLLSSAVSRRPEMALRLSLGATRGSLLRMLLIEHALLVLTAVPLAAWVAWQVPRVWRSQMPDLPHYVFGFDVETVSYLTLVSVLAALVVAMAPIMETMKGSVVAPGERQARARQRRSIAGDRLIAVQVAVSVIVVSGATLLIRGERTLRASPLGFETEHVLLVTPRVQTPPYTSATAQDFYRKLTDRLRAIREVRTVSLASAAPLGEGEAGAETVRVRRQPDVSGHVVSTAVNRISPTYFDTLDIPIVHGRGVTDRDADGNRVVVISEALARQLWPEGDALGHLLTADDGRIMEVVGVAGDVSSFSGSARRAPVVYQSRRAGEVGGALLVRVDRDIGLVAQRIREALHDLDPNTAAEPRTIGAMRRELADRLLRTVRIVVALAAGAVALAALGIYGVARLAADGRTKEIGIRIAIGATRRDIARVILWAEIRPLLLGLTAGMVLAIAMANALQQSLGRVQIDVHNTMVYGVTLALTLLLTLAAMWRPAMRAARIDPIDALRRD